MNKHKQQLAKTAKEGFTVIEVMLAVAISALMLIGVIGGVYVSINQQRYSDALRDFAEYMRTIYSEAISPQTLGIGNSPDQAILGKIVVFGSDDNDSTVYSATIVGKANYYITAALDEDFLTNLKNPDTNVQLICGNDSGQSSTVASYTPLWQSQLMQADDNPPGSNANSKLQGTMIIARSLTSATVHTAFIKDVVYNLKDQCQPDNPSVNNIFKDDLITKNRNEYDMEHDIGICVKMDGNAVTREVRIAADGRNTSAVHIMTDGESKCR